MYRDAPLVLTHKHDPNVVFRTRFLHQPVECSEQPRISLSYQDLWAKLQRISHAYNDLVSQNRELSSAHQDLRRDYNVLYDSYCGLKSKHDGLVDDAFNTRIQSWRHVVRVEELEQELCKAKQSEPRSTKRKYTDIDDDNIAPPSWSVPSTSNPQGLLNATLATPTFSSYISPPPLIKDESDDDHLLSERRLVKSPADASKKTPDELRARKRSRKSVGGTDHNTALLDTVAERHNTVIAQINQSNHQEDVLLDTNSDRVSHTQQPLPQKRQSVRSSLRRRSATKGQNVTVSHLP